MALSVFLCLVWAPPRRPLLRHLLPCHLLPRPARLPASARMMEERSHCPVHVSHPLSQMLPRQRDHPKRCAVTPPRCRQASGYDHRHLLRETNLHLLSQACVHWAQNLAWLVLTRLSSHFHRQTGPLAARMSRTAPYGPPSEALIHDFLYFSAHSYHLLRP